MLDERTKKFYTDRRERGMTDAMIVNELEASGWNLADAQDAVRVAAQEFVPRTAVSFQQSGDTLSYEVPAEYIRAARAKGVTIVAALWLLYAAYIAVDAISNGMSVLVVLLSVGIPVAGTWFFWNLQTAWVPRSITIDAAGIHLLSGSRKKVFPWSAFEGYSVGSPKLSTTTHGGQLIPLPQSESAVISLYLRKKQNAFTSEHQRYHTLPFPPQHAAAVAASIHRFLPEGDVLRAKPTLVDARGIVTIILAIAMVLFMLYEGIRGLMGT